MYTEIVCADLQLQKFFHFISYFCMAEKVWSIVKLYLIIIIIAIVNIIISSSSCCNCSSPDLLIKLLPNRLCLTSLLHSKAIEEYHNKVKYEGQMLKINKKSLD